MHLLVEDALLMERGRGRTVSVSSIHTFRIIKAVSASALHLVLGKRLHVDKPQTLNKPLSLVGRGPLQASSGASRTSRAVMQNLDSNQ